MKKIDYKLNILGEKEEFKPNTDIVSPLIESESRIFEIRAENGYGKTFLLNLLAFAIGNYDKKSASFAIDDFSNEFKEKVLRYKDTSKYHLSYEIELPLSDGRALSLNGTNQPGGQSIEIDGKKYTPNLISKEVEFLYTTPLSPTEQMDKIMGELSKWHRDAIGKCKDIYTEFERVALNASKSRDENKIEKLKGQIRYLDGEIESKEKELGILEGQRAKVLKFDLLEFYQKKEDEYNQLSNELVSIEHEMEGLNASSGGTNYKSQKILENARLNLTRAERKLKEKCDEIIEILNKNQEIIGYLKESSSAKKAYEFIHTFKIEELETVDLPQLTSLLNEMQKVFFSFFNEKENSQVNTISQALKKLLDDMHVLEEVQPELVEKVAEKNYLEVKNVIEELIEGYKVKNYSHIENELKNSPSAVKALIADYFKKEKVCMEEEKKSEKPKDEIRLSQLNHKKRVISPRLEELEGQIKKSKTKLINTHGIDRSVFERPSEFRMAYEAASAGKPALNISDINNELEKLLGEIEAEKSKRSVQDHALKLEEKKEMVDLSKSQVDKVIKLTSYFAGIIKDLEGWSVFINNNSDRKRQISSNEKKYIESIGRVLASTLGSKLLRKDGSYEELSHYDISSKEFILKDGRVIQADDLSTGLATGNYLRQKINNLTSKNLIICLDEIGNMSPVTRSEVIDEIKGLSEQGRLTLALLTQPPREGNRTEVIPF